MSNKAVVSYLQQAPKEALARLFLTQIGLNKTHKHLISPSRFLQLYNAIKTINHDE